MKTGVQKLIDTKLDSRFRGNDMDNGIRLYCFLKGFSTPLKAGVQKLIDTRLDSRLRGNDMDNRIRLYCFLKGFSTPLKAGVQKLIDTRLDSRFRGNDMDNGIQVSGESPDTTRNKEKVGQTYLGLDNRSLFNDCFLTGGVPIALVDRL